MKKLVALTAMALIATSAHAGLTATDSMDTVNPPTTAGLVAYNVFISGTSGDMLAGFDGAIWGDMHQVWKLDADTGEYTVPTHYRQDLATAGGKYRNDTHSAFMTAELAIVTAPSETNNKSEGSGAGWGALDLGKIGIFPAYQTTAGWLARVVLAQNTTATLIGQAANQHGAKTDIEYVIGVPEPATMVLLGIGAFGLVRKRGR